MFQTCIYMHALDGALYWKKNIPAEIEIISAPV